jgi:hypothetical protein
MAMAAVEHVAQVDDVRAAALADVAAAVELRQQADEHLRYAVAAARTFRHSWAALGDVLGLTGEGARAHYGRRPSRDHGA